MVAKSLFVCLLLGLLLLYPASASTLLSSSSEASSVETPPQPLTRVHSHIDHTSDMALHLLDSLDGKHARGWTLADLWSPMADDAKAHHDVKRGDLLSKERLADFAAGGVLGVVFVLVAMGVGVTCRLFVCRRRRTEHHLCHIINSSLVDPAEAEAEALLPEFSYTDLEQERLKRLKESGQQQQPKRKWWQNGRGRVEAAQLANEPQEVEQMAPAAAKVHQCDVEEGLKEQVEGGEPKSHQEAQSQSLLLFGRWRWTQAPPRGSAAAAASATRDTSSRPLAVTQLDPSPSPPWKRRASEGARVV